MAGTKTSVSVPGSVPVKAFASHADDVEKVAAYAVLARDGDRASEDFRIAPEAAHPVIVGEDGDRVRARLEIVVFGEQTPQRGPESEGAEHPS